MSQRLGSERGKEGGGGKKQAVTTETKTGGLTVRLRSRDNVSKETSGDNGDTFFRNLSDVKKIKGPSPSRSPAPPQLSSPTGKIQGWKMTKQEPGFALFKLLLVTKFPELGTRQRMSPCAVRTAITASTLSAFGSGPGPASSWLSHLGQVT